MDLNGLVQIIGYQLTAFIGSTDTRTVGRWLHDGVPDAAHSRMQALWILPRRLSGSNPSLLHRDS
jgi:hypothetical protein